MTEWPGTPGREEEGEAMTGRGRRGGVKMSQMARGRRSGEVNSWLGGEGAARSQMVGGEVRRRVEQMVRGRRGSMVGECEWMASG